MSPVSALPETLMFCALELVPKLALKPESAAGVTVTEGGVPMKSVLVAMPR